MALELGPAFDRAHAPAEVNAAVAWPRPTGLRASWEHLRGNLLGSAVGMSVWAIPERRDDTVCTCTAITKALSASSASSS